MTKTRDVPTYSANCRHYRGQSNASCSFRIYGNPNPEMPRGTIYAEGIGLTTEEMNAALRIESERWGAGPWANVTWTEGRIP